MDGPRIRARIEAALRQEHDEHTRRDVAFHMTDWLGELRELVRIYEEPGAASDEQVEAALMAFLVHAPEHIAAAAKLYAGSAVRDIFGVSAVEVDAGSS